VASGLANGPSDGRSTAQLAAAEAHLLADELSHLLLERWPACRLDRAERRAP
jgi:hypothetical protein